MSAPEALMLIAMVVSFIVYAGALRVCRRMDEQHDEMIRRHERWREDSRQQFASDMAAIERLLDTVRRVEK